MFISGLSAGIKITSVGFLVRHPVGATLCTDYRQVWQGGGGPNILLSAKVENLGNSGQENMKKLCSNVENARKN